MVTMLTSNSIAKKILAALKDGTVSEADINRAAGHVLYEMVRFGYLDGQSKHEVTAQSIEENARIIEKTGEESAVLLKNEGHALPLKDADLDSVVLIGPTAAQVDAIGINGERSVGLPQRQIGPLEAMRKITGNANIRFAVDDDMTGTTDSCQRLQPRRQAGLGPHGCRRRDGGCAARLHGCERQGAPLQLDITCGRVSSLRPTPAITGSIFRPWAPTPVIKLDGKRLAAPALLRAACTATFCKPTRTTPSPPPMA